ncbi:unnamed protein product, partial [Durusdinium trenchii]
DVDGVGLAVGDQIAARQTTSCKDFDDDGGDGRVFQVKPTSLPSECFSCGMLESSSGWVAESSELGEWYQMDAGAPTHVSGIAIKKRADADEWISKFL